MGASSRADSTREEEQRHICCTMTSVLLRTVRTADGEAGVSLMLTRAGSPHDAAFLENTGNWISLHEAVALMEAGVEVTGDPQLARRVGEQAVAQHAGTQVATMLRSLGSPEAVLRGIMTTAAKFSTVTEMTASETGPSHAVVHSRTRAGLKRHPLMCDWAKGLLSQPCVLFGLPPARVEETECQAHGGSECRYEISWDRELAEAAADPEQRVTALEAQVVAMSQRLESAYATASDLVSPDDFDTVLARIVERAADAVRAPGYVLSVRPDPAAEPLVFTEGVSSQEAVNVVSSADQPGTTASAGVLCVEVASSRRRYGHLFALHPAGMSFFPQEKQLLLLYAKHAAAVLDTALALREASRRHEHVSALLSLSQAMARADSITEVAHEVADAMVDLVGCDRSSIWLWDEASASMRREWTSGAPPAVRRQSLRIHDTPYLARMLQDPRPMFFDHEEQDPILVAMMTDARLVAMAVVPIIAHDMLLAMLTVGVEEGPERLRRSPDLLEKLNGIAALAAPAVQNRQLIDELGHQVLHDALTGVLNRTGFGRALEVALAADVEVPSQAGLLYVDIDGFKELNDQHGHQIGDELLREVAERLRLTVRGDDVVARLGGDEFAVILPRLTSAEEVHAAAQRVHEAVAAPFTVGDRIVHVLASVGEAISPTHGTTIDDLVKHADADMYNHKAHRRAPMHSVA